MGTESMVCTAVESGTLVLELRTPACQVLSYYSSSLLCCSSVNSIKPYRNLVYKCTSVRFYEMGVMNTSKPEDIFQEAEQFPKLGFGFPV